MANMVGTPRMIKLLNKDVIENIIKAEGPITKPEISQITKLSLVTVNKTVEALVQENKVKLSGIHESTGGRRAQYFEINEELYYFVGLYYTNNEYLGGISNSLGNIIFQETYSAGTESYEQIMKDTYDALDKLMKQCEGHTVSAIGMGVPGVVNDGVITNIPTIPFWEGKNVAQMIETRYGIEVVMENDINLATVGVYSNNYKDQVDSLALIYFEQGIGSGLIINRELFKGSTNFAGELSYFPVHSSFVIDGEKKRYKGTFENRITLLREALESGEGNQDELREIMRKTIADALIGITCVINPEILVIKNNLLTEEDFLQIENKVKEAIDSVHVPQIVCLEDLKPFGIQGVINTCIHEVTSIYSLSSRKQS